MSLSGLVFSVVLGLGYVSMTTVSSPVPGTEEKVRALHSLKPVETPSLRPTGYIHPILLETETSQDHWQCLFS